MFFASFFAAAPEFAPRYPQIQQHRLCQPKELRYFSVHDLHFENFG